MSWGSSSLSCLTVSCSMGKLLSAGEDFDPGRDEEAFRPPEELSPPIRKLSNSCQTWNAEREKANVSTPVEVIDESEVVS